MNIRSKPNYFLTIFFGVIYLMAMIIGMYIGSRLTADRNVMLCISFHCFFMGLWTYFIINDIQKNG